MDILREIENFYTYCLDFYSFEIGIYPIADADTIREAIGEYIKQPKTHPIEFDTLDREKVREIIEKQFIKS